MQDLRTFPFNSIGTLVRVASDCGGVDPTRRLRMIGLLVRYAMIEPFRWIEQTWADPRASAHHPPEDPIFVLGHWRSGTTYLQRLLSLDPRFTTLSLFESLFADAPTATNSWFQPTLNFLMHIGGAVNPIHRTPLDFSAPGETDVALCSQLSQASYIWGYLFPQQYEAWLNRCVFQPAPDISETWLAALDQTVRKVSWLRNGRRVVLKSPGDTARVSLLAQRYPNARFVYIHRDPISVYQSNRGLWDVVRKNYSLQDVTDRQIDRYIVRTYKRLLTRYLEQRECVPASRLVEVRYENLRQFPEREMLRIYDMIGLGVLPDRLCGELAVPNTFRTNTYANDPALHAQLCKEWAFAFENWPTPASDGACA